MKRTWTAVAVATVVLSGALHATFARLGGMGITQNWMVEQDDSLIWLNPAEINTYSGFLWGELGQAGGSAVAPRVNNNLTLSSQWGGVSAGLGPVTAALFLGQQRTSLLSLAGDRFAPGGQIVAIPAIPAGTAFDVLDPVGKFDVLAGMPMGNLGLGMSVSFADDGTSTESSNLTQPSLANGDLKYSYQRYSSDLLFNFGAKLVELGPLSSVDAVLTLGMHGVNNKYSDEMYFNNAFVSRNSYSLKLTGSMGVQFQARGVMMVGDASSFILYVGYGSDDASNEFSRKTDTDLDGTPEPEIPAPNTEYYYRINQTLTASSLRFGFAANTNVAKNMLLIMGGNIETGALKVSESQTDLFSARNGIVEEFTREVSWFNIPVNVGFEYAATKAVVLRTGVSKNLFQTQTTKETDPDYAAWNGTSYPLVGTVETTTTADNAVSGVTVSLGAGVTLTGNLKIDAVVRQQVLFSGTFVVSGVPETLFSQLSAIYRF